MVAPDTQDLLLDKAHAFQAGVVAGERLQAKRDAAGLAGLGMGGEWASGAALVAETAASCPAPVQPAAPPPAAPIPPVAPVTGGVPAPSYAPGGPAVPVAPAN